MEGNNKGRKILETAGLERDEGQQGYYLYTQGSFLGRQQAAFRDVLEQLIEGNVPTIKMFFFPEDSHANPFKILAARLFVLPRGRRDTIIPGSHHTLKLRDQRVQVCLMQD